MEWRINFLALLGKTLSVVHRFPSFPIFQILQILKLYRWYFCCVEKHPYLNNRQGESESVDKNTVRRNFKVSVDKNPGYNWLGYSHAGTIR
jgi:hypothetical protein